MIDYNLCVDNNLVKCKVCNDSSLMNNKRMSNNIRCVLAFYRNEAPLNKNDVARFIKRFTSDHHSDGTEAYYAFNAIRLFRPNYAKLIDVMLLLK